MLWPFPRPEIKSGDPEMGPSALDQLDNVIAACQSISPRLFITYQHGLANAETEPRAGLTKLTIRDPRPMDEHVPNLIHLMESFPHVIIYGARKAEYAQQRFESGDPVSERRRNIPLEKFNDIEATLIFVERLVVS